MKQRKYYCPKSCNLHGSKCAWWDKTWPELTSDPQETHLEFCPFFMSPLPVMVNKCACPDSDAVCPDDCECLGRMLSVCFARPILSAHGKGFTLNIPVVANLRRCDKEGGSVYYRQEHCHYERFKNDLPK